MDYYLIIARSITYAQRMSKALERVGVGCRIFRAPAGLTEHGCAYAVRVRVQDLTTALIALNTAGFRPVKVFLRTNNAYQEVEI